MKKIKNGSRKHLAYVIFCVSKFGPAACMYVYLGIYVSKYDYCINAAFNFSLSVWGYRFLDARQPPEGLPDTRQVRVLFPHAPLTFAPRGPHIAIMLFNYSTMENLPEEASR